MKAQNLTELIAWQPPPKKFIISGGILLPQTKLILFGKFQTWKSMLAIDTAFSLALGKNWFGYETTKSLLYILQIEVPKAQYRERVIKYYKGNNVYTDDINFNTEHYIKLDRGYGMDYLEKELNECNPSVLIIDPVYKIMTGRITDEWDVRQLTDRMDKLIDKYKLAIILIHHDRKSLIIEGQPYYTAEDMFGSSIFLDWCDTSIRTSNTGSNEVTLSFEKVRYAEEELKPMVIGIDRSKLKFRRKP